MSGISSEFALIRRFFTRPTPHVLLGVGDDAALLKPTPGMVLAVSTDMLVAERHFFIDADPYWLGRKALAVNLSDMAAMGATPRWVTLALALPRADESWLADFSRGFFEIAEEFGVTLIGGDTTRGPLNLCVQILGEVPPDKALRRDGAKPGDDVWVSGELGGAALALAYLRGHLTLTPEEKKTCLPRLHNPAPRVALGLALREVAHSAIDISDGLLADLGHILERSHVGAELTLASVPAAAPLRHRLADDMMRRCLLAGGDDYELCFTALAARRDEVIAIAQRMNVPLTRIGTIRSGSGLRVTDPNNQPLPIGATGFDHFA